MILYWIKLRVKYIAQVGRKFSVQQCCVTNAICAKLINGEERGRRAAMWETPTNTFLFSREKCSLHYTTHYTGRLRPQFSQSHGIRHIFEFPARNEVKISPVVPGVPRVAGNPGVSSSQESRHLNHDAVWR